MEAQPRRADADHVEVAQRAPPLHPLLVDERPVGGAPVVEHRPDAVDRTPATRASARPARPTISAMPAGGRASDGQPLARERDQMLYAVAVAQLDERRVRALGREPLLQLARGGRVTIGPVVHERSLYGPARKRASQPRRVAQTMSDISPSRTLARIRRSRRSGARRAAGQEVPAGEGTERPGLRARTRRGGRELRARARAAARHDRRRAASPPRARSLHDDAGSWQAS